jgi:hypothetical protein
MWVISARLLGHREPIPASWLNQVEIHLSIVERKALAPRDFAHLAEVEQRLIAFERHYEATAKPFEWKFTRADLAAPMRRLGGQLPLQPTA